MALSRRGFLTGVVASVGAIATGAIPISKLATGGPVVSHLDHCRASAKLLGLAHGYGMGPQRMQQVASRMHRVTDISEVITSFNLHSSDLTELEARIGAMLRDKLKANRTLR